MFFVFLTGRSQFIDLLSVERTWSWILGKFSERKVIDIKKCSKEVLIPIIQYFTR